MVKVMLQLNIAYLSVVICSIGVAAAITLESWLILFLLLLVDVMSIYNLVTCYRNGQRKEKEMDDRMMAAEKQIMDLQKIAALAHMRLDVALAEDDEDNEDRIGLN